MVPCRVSVPLPPPPLAMIYTRNLVRVVTLVSRVPTVAGMGSPSPRILVSVVAFEAMQLRVSKVATLTWMGHGFGLRRAQLRTLSLNPAIHL